VGFVTPDTQMYFYVSSSSGEVVFLERLATIWSQIVAKPPGLVTATAGS
jgi:hypothetical protein